MNASHIGAPMRKLALSACLILIACGTPQEQCIRAGTSDLREVDRLITEVEGNIQRGFGYRTVTFQTMEWVDCTPAVVAGQPAPAPRTCAFPVTESRRETVALDMAAERRKLVDLQAKKVDLDRAALRVTADCRAKFPQ